jgi:hypothetical protein
MLSHIQRKKLDFFLAQFMISTPSPVRKSQVAILKRAVVPLGAQGAEGGETTTEVAREHMEEAMDREFHRI